jgi:DNA-binding NtrC family response regulator
MPSMNGMDLQERMIRVDPAANVVLISERYSTESAVEAITKSACDCLTKPLDIQRPQSRYQRRTGLVRYLQSATRRR